LSREDKQGFGTTILENKKGKKVLVYQTQKKEAPVTAGCALLQENKKIQLRMPKKVGKTSQKPRTRGPGEGVKKKKRGAKDLALGCPKKEERKKNEARKKRERL